MGGDEVELVRETFESNWIAPLGPQVDAFEKEFADVVGVAHACCSFIRYRGASPESSDVGCRSRRRGGVPDADFWGLGIRNHVCGAQTRYFWTVHRRVGISTLPYSSRALEKADREGALPAVLVAVDLYGQSVDWQPVIETCGRFGVPIIEDAAEALGATYKGKPVGGFGRCGVFSFNGNKIITTSGGGMMVSDDALNSVEKAQTPRDPSARSGTPLPALGDRIQLPDVKHSRRDRAGTTQGVGGSGSGADGRTSSITENELGWSPGCWSSCRRLPGVDARGGSPA